MPCFFGVQIRSILDLLGFAASDSHSSAGLPVGLLSYSISYNKKLDFAIAFPGKRMDDPASRAIHLWHA
jgi:hypothetical protein